VYLDDVLITSAEGKDHNKCVRMVLQRLHNAGIVINAAKCQYARLVVLFLAHKVNAEGIQLDSTRVQPVLDYP
jgi:hypothetical protein